MDSDNSSADSEVQLLYDAECPVCNVYCKAARIRQTAGPLILVDARQASDIKDDLTRQGLDVDQGMALKIGDQLYYGAAAIHMLSQLSSRSGVFNRVTYWMFNSNRRARALYPVFRSVRNLLLKAMGRTKINNLGLPGNQRF